MDFSYSKRSCGEPVHAAGTYLLHVDLSISKSVRLYHYLGVAIAPSLKLAIGIRHVIETAMVAHNEAGGLLFLYD